jgi:hypothetical protein
MAAAKPTETLMITPADRNEIRIDRTCSAAICEEIGHRLRIRLASEPDRLPQHLMIMIDRIAADQASIPANEVIT